MPGTNSIPEEDDVVSVGEPLPRLAAAMIVGETRVSMTWRDGHSITVDLDPVLQSHRHFIPLRGNHELFQTLRVNEDGTALEWDDGIELSAYWIATLPAVGMDNAEFRQIMTKLGLSLDGMASQLGISRRLIAEFRGTRPIPAYVALASRYLAGLADRGPKDTKAEASRHQPTIMLRRA
jgi:hypothetical protein